MTWPERPVLLRPACRRFFHPCGARGDATVGRARLFPADDLTHGEWRYLWSRYPADEATERRERLVLTLRRLVRKGSKAEQIHRALMLGTRLWEAHTSQQTERAGARKWNAAVARAQRDVQRALSSLRRLLPADFTLDDDRLFELRDELLVSRADPPSARPRGGRPWHWKQEAEEALRQCGVVASDRRELMSAIGFVDDDEGLGVTDLTR